MPADRLLPEIVGVPVEELVVAALVIMVLAPPVDDVTATSSQNVATEFAP